MTTDTLDAAARGRLAERLVPVALAFVDLVRRNGDQEAIGAFLDDLSAEQTRALPVILAAMVDDEATPQELLSWVDFDEHGRSLPAGAEMVLWSPPKPQRREAACGSPSGAERHRRNGERPCRECLDAYNAARQARKETRQREGAAA